MAPARDLTRRHFLGGLAASSIAMPAIVPGSVLGRDDKAAPSERITVGFIGCGKMANDYHLHELLRFGDVQALAVCEVDRTRRGHHRNWLDCIRSRKRPLADVEIGARSVAITILGNLAYWNGRHPSTLGPGQVGVCGRCRGQPLARPQAPGPVAASGRLRGAWSPMPARGRKTLTRAIPRP
ncbi:MAG: hypothetical protein ACLQU5_09060 [Isosphaeraceae bacterium]